MLDLKLRNALLKLMTINELFFKKDDPIHGRFIS